MINQGESSQTTDNEVDLLSLREDQDGFQADVMISHNKLKKVNQKSLSLSADEVFSSTLWKNIKAKLSRKNEIFYCVTAKEISVDISETSGRVYLPLLPTSEVSRRLNQLRPEIAKKINIVHLGAIRILVTAQFREGINSPIKMALVDNRINDRKDSIIGVTKGNLIYRKFIFTVYPKFEVSLKTQNFDQILSLIHKFERTDLMNPGDKVFSITYLTAYALTNSVHSVHYRNSSTIELDEVFADVGEVQQNPFGRINEDTNWVLDIAPDKPRLGQQPNISVYGNQLRVGERAESSRTMQRVPSRNLRRTESLRIEEDSDDKIEEVNQRLKEVQKSMRELLR